MPIPVVLDLDAQHARRAQELGVKLVINTDAHAADHLQLMPYGVSTARRGWIEPQNVLNTWSTADFLDWVQHRGK